MRSFRGLEILALVHRAATLRLVVAYTIQPFSMRNKTDAGLEATTSARSRGSQHSPPELLSGGALLTHIFQMDIDDLLKEEHVRRCPARGGTRTLGLVHTVQRGGVAHPAVTAASLAPPDTCLAPAHSWCPRRSCTTPATAGIWIRRNRAEARARCVRHDPMILAFTCRASAVPSTKRRLSRAGCRHAADPVATSAAHVARQIASPAKPHPHRPAPLLRGSCS